MDRRTRRRQRNLVQEAVVTEVYGEARMFFGAATVMDMVLTDTPMACWIDCVVPLGDGLYEHTLTPRLGPEAEVLEGEVVRE